jgi:hypothetical protein
MDIDQLFSIIEEEKTYTEETISEVKNLIEKFPYFQTGHMLLLKAMHMNKPDKFNDQLNISGSFIPDKVRLFKFINNKKETPAKETAKTIGTIKKEPPIEKELPTKKEILAEKEKIVRDIKTEV